MLLGDHASDRLRGLPQNNVIHISAPEDKRSARSGCTAPRMTPTPLPLMTPRANYLTQNKTEHIFLHGSIGTNEGINRVHISARMRETVILSPQQKTRGEMRKQSVSLP